MASLVQDALDYAAEQTQQALAALGSTTTKETTVWMDGAFDVMHFGHANAFRQGRTLGTRLVVGVNSSNTIEQAKGAPPLLTDEERCAAVKACRFVDDVVPHVPYIMNEAYVRDLLENKGIDYIVHGDDPCIVDGKDVYQAAKDLGRYKTIPRTEGVSTTDLVGRLLRLDDTSRAFLGTARILSSFSEGLRAPLPTERVVYVAGAWDLFHPGHSKFLEACRSCGDYLLVGVYGDACVERRRHRLPLMNLQERVLSVLACRHVDDVLIDAPSEITPERHRASRCGRQSAQGRLAVAFEFIDARGARRKSTGAALGEAPEEGRRRGRVVRGEGCGAGVIVFVVVLRVDGVGKIWGPAPIGNPRKIASVL
jgi:cytidyltransferase-like protein